MKTKIKDYVKRNKKAIIFVLGVSSGVFVSSILVGYKVARLHADATLGKTVWNGVKKSIIRDMLFNKNEDVVLKMKGVSNPYNDLIHEATILIKTKCIGD